MSNIQIQPGGLNWSEVEKSIKEEAKLKKNEKNGNEKIVLKAKEEGEFVWEKCW